MSITFACGHCGKTFTIEDKFAGKKGKCKQCGSVMQIPGLATSRALAPNSTRQENSPPKRIPNPAPAPVPDIFGFDEDVRPRQSAVTDLDEDDFEPGENGRPLARSAGSFDPPKKKKAKKKKRSGVEPPVMLIGRILLGLAIGSAGTYASVGFIGQVQKTLVPGFHSKGEAEVLFKERIALNLELADMISKVEDIPSAIAASGAVNQKVRAMTANLRKLRLAKGLATDMAALNRQYQGQMNQATNQLLQEFLKIAQNPAVFNALNVADSMKELDTEEKLIPGTNQNANIPGPIQQPFTPPNFNPPTPPGMPNGPGNRGRSNRGRGNGPNFGPGGP